MDAAVDPGAGLATVNSVRLVGRLSAMLTERELPSGDQLGSFRVVVDRLDGVGRGRRALDAIDCHTWSARVRRQAASWALGDVVALEGALRRRFFRSDTGGTQSITEVEVTRARIVKRADS